MVPKALSEQMAQPSAHAGPFLCTPISQQGWRPQEIQSPFLGVLSGEMPGAGKGMGAPGAHSGGPWPQP